MRRRRGVILVDTGMMIEQGAEVVGAGAGAVVAEIIRVGGVMFEWVGGKDGKGTGGVSGGYGSGEVHWALVGITSETDGMGWVQYRKVTV